jgi:hypothetical protein
MKRLTSMPATSANLAAALIIALTALIALKYLRAGTLTFVVLCYGVWLSARACNLWFGLMRNRPWFLHGFLSAYEKGIYKRFALYLHSPPAAFFFSTTLHWLRIALVGWIAVALWQGLYAEAVALTLFLILAAGTISTMYPDLYFEEAANRGNDGAAEMLHALRHIQSMLAPNEERPSA